MSAKNIEKLQGEYLRLSKRVEELEFELERMRRSPSWRITEPLRMIKPSIGYLRSILRRRKHLLTPSPFNDLIGENGSFEVTGEVPYLLLQSHSGRHPVGWTRFSLIDADASTPRSYALYIDRGHGFSEEERQTLEFDHTNTIDVRLPRMVRNLRLDPIEPEKHFRLPGIEVREVGFSRIVYRSLSLRNLIAGCREFFRNGKFGFTYAILGDVFTPIEKQKIYRRWINKIESRMKTKKIDGREPLLSIVMPVYNTQSRYLRKALDSVLQQSYTKFEICIADDASSRASVRTVLEEYTQAHPNKIRVCYREENGHISKCLNSALALATGDYVVLFDHDDELPAYALQEVVSAINENPDAALLYSDEDRITANGERIDPYFKPDFSIELLREQNCISHLGVYRTKEAKEIGGFREGFEGSQDWDFALRFVEHVGVERVSHIPRVLYHWRLVPQTVSFTVETKRDAFDAGRLAVSEHITRTFGRGEGAVHGWSYSDFSKPSTFDCLIGLQNKEQAIALAGLINSCASIRKAVVFYPEESPELLIPFESVSKPIVESVGVLTLRKGIELLNCGAHDRIAIIDGVSSLSADAFNEAAGLLLTDSSIAGVGGTLLTTRGNIDNAGYVITRQSGLVPVLAGNRRGVGGYFGRGTCTQSVSAVDSRLFLFRSEYLGELTIPTGDVLNDTYAKAVMLSKESKGRLLWSPKFEGIATNRELLAEFSSEHGVGSDKFYNKNLSERGDYFFGFQKSLSC